MDAFRLVRGFISELQQEILVAFCALLLLTFIMAWVALGRCRKLRRKLAELQESVRLLDSAEQRRLLKEMRGPTRNS